jgi:hypothetical protein
MGSDQQLDRVVPGRAQSKRGCEPKIEPERDA